MKIIDVFICKARAKLTPHGIEITTVWGRGYMDGRGQPSQAHRAGRARGPRPGGGRMKCLAKSWQRFVAALVLFAGASAFDGFIGLGFRLLFFALVVRSNEEI